LVSQVRSWLRQSESSRDDRWIAALLALVALALFAPATAGTTIDQDMPPIVTYTIDGIPGTSGWYRGSKDGDHVVLRWSVRDPGALFILTMGCDTTVINGPSPGTARTCTAWSEDGTTSVTTRAIKIDANPPAGVSASISRAPDWHGWHNHPVTVTWSGQDAMSGIASCTSVTYSGPESAQATLKGGCTDVAGNDSLSTVVLKYDQTPPKLTRIVVRTGARLVALRWKASSDTQFLLTRSPGRGGERFSVVYQGVRRRFSDHAVTSGVSYRYTLRALDAAGNSVVKSLSATPRPALYAPPLNARLRSRRSLLFAWVPVPRTSYYNVQLWRGGEKVLSTWPSFARFRLSSPWVFGGRLRALRTGRYTWYVWPGRGPKSRGVYGPLLGSSTFVVTR
jgi:hypothetical protein